MQKNLKSMPAFMLSDESIDDDEHPKKNQLRDLLTHEHTFEQPNFQAPTSIFVLNVLSKTVP